MVNIQIGSMVMVNGHMFVRFEGMKNGNPVFQYTTPSGRKDGDRFECPITDKDTVRVVRNGFFGEVK